MTPLDKTVPSHTVTRPDDDVGKPGSRPAGGGRQTPEQARLTDLGQEGRSDADRNRAQPHPKGGPAPVGGASSGHAEQQSTDGRLGKVAEGHHATEKDRR